MIKKHQKQNQIEKYERLEKFLKYYQNAKNKLYLQSIIKI